MKKIVILFVTLLLVCVVAMSSLISIYAYCEEENTATDETNVDMEEENSTYSSRSTIIEGGGEINGELWYAIDLDAEGKPIITYDIDYSGFHLLEYLKPGDIVYERNAGFDVVDFLGHIAMVVEVVQATPTQPGYVLMIESLPSVINNPYTGEPRELGVCYSIMTPTRFDVKHVSIMRVKNATDTQIQEAINWAVSQLGRSWRVPINKFIDNDDPNKAWYCSELVWAAYCMQDIDLVEDNILPVAPKDIYESNEVATILDYRWREDSENYETTFDTTDTHHTFNCDGDTYTEEHFYRFWTAGDETHTATCACGHTITENHSLEYENLDESDYHREYCTVCAYNETVSHDYKCYGTIGEFHSEMCLECGYHHMGLVNIPYTSVDENNHSKTCPDCGYTNTEVHNYETYNYCYEKCADCGHIRQAEEHDYTHRYSYVNDETHYAYCECGAFILSGHFYQVKEEGQLLLDVCMFCKVEKNHVHDYVYTPSRDGKTHHTSCRCGISKYEQCFGIAIQGELRRCNKCNQVLSGGLIIQRGDDGEEDALPAGKEDEEYSD